MSGLKDRFRRCPWWGWLVLSSLLVLAGFVAPWWTVSLAASTTGVVVSVIGIAAVWRGTP